MLGITETVLQVAGVSAGYDKTVSKNILMRSI